MKKDLVWAYVALGAVCFIWGFTCFSLVICLETIPPFLLGGSRQMIAGLIITGFFLIKDRKQFKINQVDLISMCISGILLIYLCNILVTWSLQWVSSGLTTLLFTFVPSIVFIIQAIILKQEKANKYKVSGLLFGLAGMVVICIHSLRDFINPEYTFGIMVTLIGLTIWAIGTVVNSRTSQCINPFLSLGLQLLLFGGLLFITGLIVEDFGKVKVSSKSTLAFLYLIVFDSIVGFGSFMYALRKLPATLVSIYAYINPIVAITLGIIFLKEKVSYNMIISGILIYLGTYLLNKGYNKSGQ
jgi:drug/metabolite transporter (DMT)-like permease